MIFVLALLLQTDFSSLYRQAYEDRHRAGHPKTAESAVELALYLAQSGKYDEAAPFLDQVLGAPHPDATVLHNWAVAIEQESPKDAEKLYRRALAMREKNLPPADVDLATTRLNLASLVLDEKLARAALGVFEKSLGPDHARTGAACGVMGAVLATKGDVPGAERYFRRSLAVSEKANGGSSLETAAALENLADLLSQTGRESAARPLFDRAKRIRAVNPNPVVRKAQPF